MGCRRVEHKTKTLKQQTAGQVLLQGLPPPSSHTPSLEGNKNGLRRQVSPDWGLSARQLWDRGPGDSLGSSGFRGCWEEEKGVGKVQLSCCQEVDSGQWDVGGFGRPACGAWLVN